MPNDPLAAPKTAIATALAAATRMRDAIASGGAVDPRDVELVGSSLSPLVASGNLLDRASNALVQCAGALQAAKQQSLGAVDANGKPVTPPGYVSQSTAAGLAVGGLVLGIAGGFAGFKYLGKKDGDKAKENPLVQVHPTMKPGYVLKLDPHSKQWEDVMVSAPDKLGARFVAYREVHGARMALFRSSNGGLYAQLATLAREPKERLALSPRRATRALPAKDKGDDA